MNNNRLLVFYEWLNDQYDDNYSNDYIITSVFKKIINKFEELDCDNLAYELNKDEQKREKNSII